MQRKLIIEVFSLRQKAGYIFYINFVIMEKKRELFTLKNTLIRKVGLILKRNPNRFFKKIKGIIHVGANTGQEIALYAKNKLTVVWIEPIPDIFDKLQSNLIGVPGQIAIKGLATDIDNAEYQFHLANNNGASAC